MGTGCSPHWGPWFSGAAGRELGRTLVDWGGAGPGELLRWPPERSLGAVGMAAGAARPGPVRGARVQPR